MCLNTKANITRETNKHTPQQPNHAILKKYIVLHCDQQKYIEMKRQLNSLSI